jgi:hypothetical protein
VRLWRFEKSERYFKGRVRNGPADFETWDLNYDIFSNLPLKLAIELPKIIGRSSNNLWNPIDGKFVMKHWPLPCRLFFILAVSCWIVFFPACCLFYSLEEMDVFRKPHLESPIQEGLLANLEKKWLGIAWIICALFLFIGRETFNASPGYLLTLHPIQQTSILRC